MGRDEAIEGTGEGGEGRFIVALSDIHLGTDAPTVWYQPEVHEAPLLHVLDWVVRNADQIRELVLLGDIVDLWTYPADVVPPTFADITATHPAVFGPDGALARALDALDGRVTYVPGNHDWGITADEVATIASPGGHHVGLVEDVPYHPLGPDDHGLAMAHGHHFTLFNAPHHDNPWAPLPVGFFVARAVATAWTDRLEEGQTVAHLPGQGAPNGIDLASLRTVAGGFGARSITASVVDFVSGALGVGQDVPMRMPDGTTATLADAKVAYANCWSEWAADHGGGLRGTSSAYRAAIADLDGTFLPWFAQQLALEHDAELVVMGHSHAPIAGLHASPIRYVNTGFDCPSLPDRDADDREHAQKATFAVIDTVELEARIWEVAADGKGHVCREADAPWTRIVGSSGMDFSTYVTVDNTHRSTDLHLVIATALYGAFVTPPPEVIPAGTKARFWIQDRFGPSGSEGRATYTDGEREIELHFTCPTFGTNSCSGTPEFATRISDRPWRTGTVIRFGHPFFVDFTI